jgi:hypothetical protein
LSVEHTRRAAASESLTESAAAPETGVRGGRAHRRKRGAAGRCHAAQRAGGARMCVVVHGATGVWRRNPGRDGAASDSARLLGVVSYPR